jgi:hypothetical protein
MGMGRSRFSQALFFSHTYVHLSQAHPQAVHDFFYFNSGCKTEKTPLLSGLQGRHPHRPLRHPARPLLKQSSVCARVKVISGRTAPPFLGLHGLEAALLFYRVCKSESVTGPSNSLQPLFVPHRSWHLSGCCVAVYKELSTLRLQGLLLAAFAGMTTPQDLFNVQPNCLSFRQKVTLCTAHRKLSDFLSSKGRPPPLPFQLLQEYHRPFERP